jgi:exonuclease III
MKILSWNCRGLGNPDAVRAYKRLLRSKCPDVVFLMETKLRKSDPNVSSKLCLGHLQNHFIVNCNSEGGGRSGGLALIWHNDVNLHLMNHNKMLIEFYVLDSIKNDIWYATGMYGYPIQSKKHLTCDTINTLYNSYHNKKWLLFGDFNLYINSSEKMGGRNVDYGHCNQFLNTLNNCELFDLGYHGNKFTWANNQEDTHHIKERLDRFCANLAWTNYFPRFTNYHLLRFTSDHSPILLEFWDKFTCRTANHHSKHLIRFEEVWSHEKESFKIVQDTWVTTQGDSVAKCKVVLHQLHHWGLKKFGDIPCRIHHIQTRL